MGFQLVRLQASVILALGPVSDSNHFVLVCAAVAAPRLVYTLSTSASRTSKAGSPHDKAITCAQTLFALGWLRQCYLREHHQHQQQHGSIAMALKD
jgi:hypothetical protein